MEQACLQLRLPAQVDLEGGALVSSDEAGDGNSKQAACFKHSSAVGQGKECGFAARQEVLQSGMIIWHHVTNTSGSDKKLASSCMSVVEETSGKTMVGTDESFTEARALQVK